MSTEKRLMRRRMWHPLRDAGLAAEEITLGADEYFVLGDNRNNSEDSRYANIGNIKKDYIIGKAWFRIAPFSEIWISVKRYRC